MTEIATITTEVPAIPQENEQSNGFGQLMSNRNFRWLWAGEGISLLGDQFYFIALPWLVLQMTGNALAMGTVLALEGIPRAVFMLVGGALTDRFSPRRVMLFSNLSRLVLVAVLAAIVITESVQLWMIYLFALLFGVMDAFFYPAQGTIVPRLVGKDTLQGANAIMQGTLQVASFAGPALAGAVIALLGSTTIVDGETVPNLRGIGWALALDALTFLASAATLWMIVEPDIEADESSNNVLQSIRQGLGAVWDDTVVRSYFILIALASIFINGPIIVGIPVLADMRFQGAAAFGIIMSAYGGGSLVGTVLSGVLPKPAPERQGIVLGTVWSGMGIGMIFLGLVNSTLLASLAALIIGLANGYVVILFITWLQQRTPEALLGRMMSVLMFASAGLIPVSHALAGAVVEWNVTGMFLVAGAFMTGIVWLSMTNPTIRRMGS